MRLRSWMRCLSVRASAPASVILRLVLWRSYRASMRLLRSRAIDAMTRSAILMRVKLPQSYCQHRGCHRRGDPAPVAAATHLSFCRRGFSPDNFPTGETSPLRSSRLKPLLQGSRRTGCVHCGRDFSPDALRSPQLRGNYAASIIAVEVAPIMNWRAVHMTHFWERDSTATIFVAATPTLRSSRLKSLPQGACGLPAGRTVGGRASAPTRAGHGNAAASLVAAEAAPTAVRGMLACALWEGLQSLRL